MKKMNNRYLQGLLMGLCATFALSLGSCVKPVEEIAPSSEMISFGAATGYENDLVTRTEYSGQDENGAIISSTSQYERIDWVANKDKVRILCAQALDQSGNPNTSGTWTVGTPTASGEKSSASVTPDTGTSPFFWGEGQHYFYALYPAAGTVSNYDSDATVAEADSKIEALNGGKALITGAIPAAQTCTLQDTIFKPNMNLAYMYEAKKTARPADGKVTLTFKPLVTTLEFSLKALDDVMAGSDLVSVQLSSTSTDLTGGFTATLDLDGENLVTFVKTGTSGQEITITLPPGTRLSKTNYSVVTFIALGVDQTDLTLTLNFDGGLTRSLALAKTVGETTTPVTVSAGKKAYFKLAVPGPLAPVFEVTPELTFDWEGNLVSPTGGATVVSTETTSASALAWTIEGYYSDEACSTALPGVPDWLTSVNGGNPGGTGSADQTPEAFPVVCPQQDPTVTSTISAEAQALNNLIGAGPVGSTSSYKNLSNPTNMDSDFIEESANCYVVNALGYYKIPLVMGNGVKNGAVNPDETTYKGFQGNMQDDWRVLFKDYKGNAIQSPYLHESSSDAGTPTSACIVWEDIDGLIEAEDYDLPAGAIVNDGSCYWLQFHVAVRRQGNAVIAIKDQAGAVMWSYHIWVSDLVPKGTGADVTFNNTFAISDSLWVDYPGDTTVMRVTKPYSFAQMTRNLGEVVYGETRTTDYPVNTVYIKFQQDVTGEISVMKVNQTGHTVSEDIDRGYPMFQWGRKDALWSNNAEKNQTWYGKNPTFSSMAGPVSQEQSIQNPDKFFSASDGIHLETVSINQSYNFNLIAPYSRWNTTDFWTMQYGRKPTRSFPSNLWDASNPLALSANETTSYAATIQYFADEIGAPVKSIVILFEFAHQRLVPTKTIWDPNPVGYVSPSTNLMGDVLGGSLTRLPQETLNMEDPTAHYNYFHGTEDLTASVTNTAQTYYTDASHSSQYTYNMGSYLRTSTGELSSYPENLVFVSAGPYILISNGRFVPRPIGINMSRANNFNIATFSTSQAAASRPFREGIGPDPILFPTGHRLVHIAEWIDILNGVTSSAPGATAPFSVQNENHGLQ